MHGMCSERHNFFKAYLISIIYTFIYYLDKPLKKMPSFWSILFVTKFHINDHNCNYGIHGIAKAWTLNTSLSEQNLYRGNATNY